VPKQTRGWDDQAQVTRAQRHKEESSDYRYFPTGPGARPRDPGGNCGSACGAGELPAALRERLVSTYGLDLYDADVLVNQGRPLVDYYEQVAALCQDPKRASNWIQQDVLRTLNETGISMANFAVTAPVLAELIRAVRDGELDTTRGRPSAATYGGDRFRRRNRHEALGIEKVSADALVALCRELLAPIRRSSRT